MTNDFVFAGFTGGRTQSAGTPTPGGTGGGESALDARGLVLAGVVIATYVQLDEAAPAFPDKTLNRVVGVYCDVLTYSNKPQLTGKVLRRCLVADSTGMHTGRVWRPRAATLDIKEGPVTGMNINRMDPRFLDGDHVVIQFLDNNVSRPLITGRLPHPQTGLGNEDLPEAGHRQRLKLVDGSPEYMKHNGTFYGVDDKGGFVIDTTRANDGVYDETGVEDPMNAGSTDGTHGDVNLRIKAGQVLHVEGIPTDGGASTFMLRLADGDLHLRLLDSNTSVRVHRASGADVITLAVNDDAGDALLELKKNQLNVQMGNSPAMVLDTSGPPKLTVGNGSDNAVLFLKLGDWWSGIKATLDSFVAAYNTHTHPVSTTGTAAAQTGTAAVTTAIQTTVVDPLHGDVAADSLRIRGG